MRPRRSDRETIQREVLRGLTEGTPLAILARTLNVNPRLVTLWGDRDPAFKEALEDARALGWDHLAHECLEIADDGRNDWMQIYDDKTGDAVGWRLNGEAVNRSRLRIETRMRLLRWWDNGRYGEGAIAAKKVEVEARISTTTRHVVDPRLLDDEQRAALRAVLAAAADQGLLALPGRDSESEPIGDDRAGLDDQSPDDAAAPLADALDLDDP